MSTIEADDDMRARDHPSESDDSLRELQRSLEQGGPWDQESEAAARQVALSLLQQGVPTHRAIDRLCAAGLSKKGARTLVSVAHIYLAPGAPKVGDIRPAPKMQRQMAWFIRAWWWYWLAMLALGTALAAPAYPLVAVAIGLAVSALLGWAVLSLMLGGLREFSQGWRLFVLVATVLAPLLGAVQASPLSLVYLLWAIFVYAFLFRRDMRREFRRLQYEREFTRLANRAA